MELRLNKTARHTYCLWGENLLLHLIFSKVGDNKEQNSGVIYHVIYVVEVD